ncbi:uncharacterized protein LOC144707056 [Wolffia australiana]
MGCNGSKHVQHNTNNNAENPHNLLLRANRLCSSFSRKNKNKNSPAEKEISVEVHPEIIEEETVESKDIDWKLFKKNKDLQIENLRRQLEQLAEELARFETWESVEEDTPDSKDEVEDEDGDNPFRTPSTGRESGEFEEEEDEFEEDLTNQFPVYDDDPFDHVQVPTALDGDLAVSHLSIEKRGPWRGRSKLGLGGSGEEMKGRSRHQLRSGKIKKRRRKNQSRGGKIISGTD